MEIIIKTVTMDENLTARPLTIHVIDNSNHECFQINLKDHYNIKFSKEDGSQSLSLFTPTEEGKNMYVLDGQDVVDLETYKAMNPEKTDTDNICKAEDDKADVISVDDKSLTTLLKQEDNINDEDRLSWYACNHCPYGTSKRYIFLRHIKKHSNDSCHDKSDLNNTNKDEHKEDFTCERTSRCNKRSYNIDNKSYSRRHESTHSEDRPFKCSKCERSYRTRSSLTNHQNVHFGKKHICQSCESSFFTTGELVRHIRYKHTLDKRYKCRDCVYAAVDRYKIKRHIKSRHSGVSFHHCHLCTFASRYPFKLKRHLLKHTGEKPYKCNQCDESFTQSKLLRAHTILHKPLGSVVYLCDMCQTKTTSKSVLRAHIKSMHTPNELTCNRCKETFPDRYYYKLHKPKSCRGFKCQLCFFATFEFLNLKYHMLIHKEKKFYCEVCDRSFNTSSSHNQHLIVVHNKAFKSREKSYKCYECNRKYAYQACLIRHEVMHKLNRL